MPMLGLAPLRTSGDAMAVDVDDVILEPLVDGRLDGGEHGTGKRMELGIGERCGDDVSSHGAGRIQGCCNSIPV